MSKTPYEDLAEKVARKICRAHRTGFGKMSERDKQETEDRAWPQHLSEAYAAIDTIHARTMEPSEEMLTVGRRLLWQDDHANRRGFMAMHAVGPTAKPSQPDAQPMTEER